MITRKDLIANPILLRDKTQGALCGLAIGDSLGDAARSPDNQRDYGFTTDFHRGDSWSTDDTEFALLTAETLILNKGEITSAMVADMWLQHVATEDELKRGGLSEVEACANLRKNIAPPLSGKFNPFCMSDGAAMRSAPIGIVWAGDPEKAAYYAEQDACVSHYMDGIWGAQAVAVAVSLAMVDATMDQIMDQIFLTIPQSSWFAANLKKALDIVKRSQGDFLEAWMPLHYELFSTHRSTVAEALPEVFGCLVLEHSSFKKGMLLAANFGRDADTIGAVAGAVLGAKFGASGIPSHWLEKTRFPSGTCLHFTKGLDIFAKAEQLAALIR